jgi:hypothetical protein
MTSQHRLISLLGCLLAVALALASGSTLRQEETIQEQFASFVARSGKTYADDRDEYARRLAIFSHNLARIAELNANSEVRAPEPFQSSEWIELTVDPMVLCRPLGGAARRDQVC